MHEIGITRNIVTIVSERALGRRVRRVTLEVGELSGVASGAIAFCFAVAARGTVAEGAALDIAEIEGRGRCRECGAEFHMATLFAACICGSRWHDPLQGVELKVRTIELEEAASCVESAAAVAPRP